MIILIFFGDKMMMKKSYATTEWLFKESYLKLVPIWSNLLTYSIYVNENRCPHYFSLILYEHHLISSISLRFSRSLIWTACQYLLELSFMNQRMDAVKCTRCCTLNYKFHLHSSARIVYLRTQAHRKRKYILCFEGGLSPSGLTQPQNKVYTSTS